MEKIEDVLTSIITVLIDIFNFILTCNVKLVQMSFYNGISFYQIGMNSLVEG